MIDVVDAELEVLLRTDPRRRPVEIGCREPVDVRREGPEALLEQRVFAGEAHREQRAAVIAALEHDDARPPGRVAGDVDGVLHGFGARVGQEGFLREVAGRDPIQDLGQGHVRLGGGHERAGVDVPIELVLHRIDHTGRSVARVDHPDPAREIQKHVAVHIVDHGALGPLHHDLGGLAETARHGGRPPVENRFPLGARDGSAELDGCHRHTVLSAGSTRRTPAFPQVGSSR